MRVIAMPHRCERLFLQYTHLVDVLHHKTAQLTVFRLFLSAQYTVGTYAWVVCMEIAIRMPAKVNALLIQEY